MAIVQGWIPSYSIGARLSTLWTTTAKADGTMASCCTSCSILALWHHSYMNGG